MDFIFLAVAVSVHRHGRHGDRLRQAGGAQMTWLYWLAGSASLGLLVYLVYALLRAEEF